MQIRAVVLKSATPYLLPYGLRTNHRARKYASLILLPRRRRDNPLVGREHCICKAALLLSKNQTVRRIVGRVCVFHDAMSLGANITGKDRSEVLAWMPGERIFRQSPLFDHQGLNVH